MLSGVDSCARSWPFFWDSICSTIWFATMSSTTPSSSPQQSALYQALPSLAEVSKFSSHACSTARTHLEHLKTARRKENSEAANLADFALCCCNAWLAKREGLSWFSNFLGTLCVKSWSTVSNSPGALCRISSSVAGLIPGERTSATPRSVLQISDRHLRRYPLLIACVRDGASGDGQSVTCIWF